MPLLSAQNPLRQMPPAVFPSVLGLMALGLAWRMALAHSAAAPLAEVFLGLVTALWLALAVGYKAKAITRLGAVVQDLETLPGRAGLSSATMGAMALAAVVMPYGRDLAFVILCSALVGHMFMAGWQVAVLRRIGARAVNPTWHLAFVGFILGAVPALALGPKEFAGTIFWLTLPMALVIWGLSLRQLWRERPVAALRPLMAVHLSPLALFATVTALSGHHATGHVLAGLTAVALGAVLLALRWLTAAGPSALWGAFTFPLAASASAFVANGQWGLGVPVLLLATCAIPPIAAMVLRDLVSGRLARATGAARA